MTVPPVLACRIALSSRLPTICFNSVLSPENMTSRVSARPNGDVSLIRQNTERAGTLRDKVVEVEGLPQKWNALRLRAREQKHRVNQPRQSCRLFLDDSQRLSIVVLRSGALRERHLRGCPNDRDRRPQLVRRIRHELPLSLEHAREPVEQRIERLREAAQFVIRVRCLQASRRIVLRDRGRLFGQVGQRPK